VCLSLWTEVFVMFRLCLSVCVLSETSMIRSGVMYTDLYPVEIVCHTIALLDH